MPTFKTKIIPEPAPKARAILAPLKLPIMQGHGDYTYLCDSCDAVLFDHINEGQGVGVAIKCPECNWFSEIDADYGP